MHTRPHSTNTTNARYCNQYRHCCQISGFTVEMISITVQLTNTASCIASWLYRTESSNGIKCFVCSGESPINSYYQADISVLVRRRLHGVKAQPHYITEILFHASPERCRKSFTMIFLGDHDTPLTGSNFGI